MSRLLALDPGQRYVGVALSDERKLTASPHSTVDREEQDLLSQLKSIIENKSVEKIVVGYPRPLRTDSNERTRQVDQFINDYINPLNLPHETVSERYTTKKAEKLRKERGSDTKASDAEAAAVILQHYIESDR